MYKCDHRGCKYRAHATIKVRDMKAHRVCLACLTKSLEVLDDLGIDGHHIVVVIL